jgi:hypothetical protein
MCIAVLLFAVQSVAHHREITPDKLVATYVVGHRFGSSSLTLEADGRYSIESGDCTMEYFDSGTYILSEGALHFTVLKQTAKGRGSEREINLLDPNERKEVFGNDASGEIKKEFKLLPVAWSERIYLIYESDSNNFANAVNLGLEPRAELSSEPYYGSFYLRQGDEQKKVSESPSLPEKWLSFLLSKPVTAAIVGIEGDAQEKMATINKGSKNGLKVGMRLLAKDEEPSLWSGAEIVSLEESSAKVRVGTELKVGDKLSTKYERRDIYR